MMSDVVSMTAIPGIQPLDDLEALWDWGTFFAGFGTVASAVTIVGEAVVIAT
jgi:hypothetical protein